MLTEEEALLIIAKEVFKDEYYINGKKTLRKHSLSLEEAFDSFYKNIDHLRQEGVIR
ncbi:TPA: hypothetical protein ACOJP0_001327 [Vibrio harveyi]|uniref:hypothetical protein n=1 Tax=Vibrio harveyi TaxID=669 RepID=UPI00390B1A6F